MKLLKTDICHDAIFVIAGGFRGFGNDNLHSPKLASWLLSVFPGLISYHVASFCIILFRITNVIASIRHLNFLIAFHMLHLRYGMICLRWNNDHTERKLLYWRNLTTYCHGSCHFVNFQCRQWWRFHQNEDISLSVHTLHICIISRGIKGQTHLIEFYWKRKAGISATLSFVCWVMD